MHPILKTRRALSAAVGTVLTAATLLALPAPSFAQDDPSYLRYRCTVLGDSTACASPTAVAADRIEVQTRAGPYARHLMYLGQSADSAIESAARDVGEVPLRRTVRVVTRQLSAAQAYQRYLGHPTPPQVSQQVMAEAQARPR